MSADLTGVAPGARLTHALRTGAGARPGVVPYITAGFPALDSAAALLLAAQAAGCAAAEVGIPFSDPLADGPTIQRTSQRALDNGMTPTAALAAVATARRDGLTIPVAVMTYVNPVLAVGMTRFCELAAASGVDGMIVPDLPAQEAGELRAAAAAAGVALVPLVAPTTTEARLADACATAGGFIYCVGVTGVTGARADVGEVALDLLARVGRHTDLPRALGFGLSRPEHLDALRGHAEAGVVGSALLDAIERGDGDPAVTAEEFLRGMVGGVSDTAARR